MSTQDLPIFLINLDRDAARLTHMTRELDRLGLTFERVPAVLGTAMPEALRGYFLGSAGAIASRLKPGEVGCYASHLLVAERIIASGAMAALVLEDDLELPDDLGLLLADLLAKAPADWDILRLSNPPKAPWRGIAALTGGRELCRFSRVPNNTGAQLVSRAGAAKLLAPGLRDLPVDEHLRRPWELRLATYGVVPAPIRSNIFDSTIDTLGDRGLGRPRARPTRFFHRGDGLASMRWQLAELGPAGFVEAALRRLAASLAKRLGLADWAKSALRLSGGRRAQR